MATWNELQDHVRSAYTLDTDEDQRFALTWNYEDGRTQRVVARRYDQDGIDMIEMKSPIAQKGGPDPLELLRENMRLPFGAVGLAGDIYLVVHNAVVADLTPDSLSTTLANVGAVADRLEAKHTEGADAF